MDAKIFVDYFCRFFAILLMVYLHISSMASIISISTPVITNFNLFVICNFLMGFVYSNYFLCLLTDPGRIPSDFVSKVLPWCRMCKCSKPPRTHHCSTCKRCVLAMDHHCPWVGGCIGFFNYPYFIRFLFYVIISSVSLFVLNMKLLNILSFSFSNGVVNEYFAQPVLISLLFREIYKRQMVYLFNCLILFIVFCTVFGLFIQQAFNLINGRTYIESLEQDTLSYLTSEAMKRASTVASRLELIDIQNKSQFPYDLGVFKNIYNVFLHPKIPLAASFFYCFPRTNGDGIHFENITNDSNKFIRWPPLIHASYSYYEDEGSYFDSDYENNDKLDDTYTSSRIRRDSEGFIIESG